ncbi:hypothetical protein BJY59DRAFT_332033 [Rhodotorula toruloides]
MSSLFARSAAATLLLIWSRCSSCVKSLSANASESAYRPSETHKSSSAVQLPTTARYPSPLVPAGGSNSTARSSTHSAARSTRTDSALASRAKTPRVRWLSKRVCACLASVSQSKESELDESREGLGAWRKLSEDDECDRGMARWRQVRESVHRTQRVVESWTSS